MKITPEDIKHISTFEPIKAAELLTELFHKKILEALKITVPCLHQRTEIQLVGKTQPPHEKDHYAHVCLDCENIVHPIAYK